MPSVLEGPDILEEDIAVAPAYDEHETLPQALPSSRRERTSVLAWLARLCTPLQRLRPRRQEYYTPRTRRFEASLDILAREHPDIHLRVMSGIG